MNPCGAILTYMDLRKVKQWWFNIPLLIGQLIFMIAGTAYGKIKWEKKWRWPNWIDVIILFGLLMLRLLMPNWCSIPIRIITVFVIIAIIRGIDWRRAWRAAQVSHVRLCLRNYPRGTSYWEYINFGYPTAKLDHWNLQQCKGRFQYRNPTFEPSDEFVAAMIEYAERQVGKGYDDLQLISSGLHLIAWIVYPPCWGKELKVIKAFNRKGGREHCISGLTADLRWGEKPRTYIKIGPKAARLLAKRSMFFTGYSTATTFPCQIAIDENWRESE